MCRGRKEGCPEKTQTRKKVTAGLTAAACTSSHIHGVCHATPPFSALPSSFFVFPLRLLLVRSLSLSRSLSLAALSLHPFALCPFHPPTDYPPGSLPLAPSRKRRRFSFTLFTPSRIHPSIHPHDHAYHAQPAAVPAPWTCHGRGFALCLLLGLAARPEAQ